MASIFTAPKMLCASQVTEHGLLFASVLMLMSAAISMETLELVTGMVGAVAVCVMKERAAKRRACCAEPVKGSLRKCNDACTGKLSKMHSSESKMSKTDFDVADGMISSVPEVDQLRACVEAELKTLRAENKLEAWKLKAERAESELVQLLAKVAQLENDLATHEATQTPVEELLMELSETKLRAEEVEADLVQAQTKMTELEGDVAQAVLLQRETAGTAQTHLEELSGDLTKANDQWATDDGSVLWTEDDIFMQLQDELRGSLRGGVL